MVLGSGMPILYFLFSLYLLLSFIIDKALTIKYYKTPPKYGLNINNTFISFSFSGIALHFLIAIWIFGNPSFMSGKLMTDKGFLNKLKQRIINETTQIIVLNVLITLLFVIVYLIIKKINENSRNKFDDLFHSNLSIDELLTEDVMNQINKEYSQMEICLAFPTRQVLELFIHKLFILINTLNKSEGNDN